VRTNLLMRGGDGHPARAMGEARPRQPEPRWQRSAGERGSYYGDVYRHQPIYATPASP
jgi:hypothetical protein